MDSVYPGLDTVTSLFPSPAQSPISYGTTFDIWSEWPASSNCDYPGNCNVGMSPSPAADPELPLVGDEMEDLWWEGNIFPELNYPLPPNNEQALPLKTMYCTEECTEYLNESAEQLQYKPQTPPIVVLGVNLSSLGDEFSWLPSIEEEHCKEECQNHVPDERGYMYGKEQTVNQNCSFDPAMAALAFHDYTNRTFEPPDSSPCLYQYPTTEMLNQSRSPSYTLSPLLTPVTTPELNTVTYPITPPLHFPGSTSAPFPMSPAYNTMPLQINVNGVIANPSPPKTSSPIKSQVEEKSFQCTFNGCKKIYAKSSHLKAHLRRHTGEKPFACTWAGCEWRFSRSDELSRHRRSHSGIKPYQCPTCEKGFSRSDHLAKHLKVHSRQRWISYNGKGGAANLHMRREKKINGLISRV